MTRLGFLGGSSGKESTCQCRRFKRCKFDPWIGKIPWRRAWWPIPVFLPGESHGQRSLEGCSPQGCKVSDTTKETMLAVTILSSSMFHDGKVARKHGSPGLSSSCPAGAWHVCDHPTCMSPESNPTTFPESTRQARDVHFRGWVTA